MAWRTRLMLRIRLLFSVAIGSALGNACDTTARSAAIADSINAAVSPRSGEVVYTPDPDDTTKYLMDRLSVAAKAHANWRFSQPQFRHTADGTEDWLKLQLNDGSALRIFEASSSRGPGLVVSFVHVSR
jgi:hypothetical protein